MTNNSCIFIKDPHLLLGFIQPSNREDTFFNEIQNKWDFIAEYVKKHKIKYVIFTGDLFDKTQISQWYWKIIIKNKKFLLDFKKKSGASLYSIRGNHDELNGINSSEDTIFEYMVELNIINHIGTKTKPLELNIENKKVCIYGFDWNPSSEKLKKSIMERKYSGDYNIAVLHASVVDQKSGKEFFDCVSYDYLINANNKIDTWVLGHYHKGFPVTFHKGKYFINPWNLTRLSRVDYVLNDEHTPEFIHSIFNVKNGKIEQENLTIKIPFIKYENAFKKDVKKIDDLLIDNFKFFTEIKNEITENFDESDKLNEMFKNKEIKKEVFDIIKEALS